MMNIFSSKLQLTSASEVKHVKRTYAGIACLEARIFICGRIAVEGILSSLGFEAQRVKKFL
jgi:hypothetical protein